MARAVKLTLEEFVKRSEAIHGIGVYDYSETQCEGAFNLLRIKCPRHGMFSQTQNSHLNGRGCAWCRKPNDNIFNYIKELNAKNGWNLIGGNSELAIPSKVTAGGYYRFDGFDRERCIIFEYDDRFTNSTPRKKARLKEWIKDIGLEGKVRFLVYNACQDILTTETM